MDQFKKVKWLKVIKRRRKSESFQEFPHSKSSSIQETTSTSKSVSLAQSRRTLKPLQRAFTPIQRNQERELQVNTTSAQPGSIVNVLYFLNSLIECLFHGGETCKGLILPGKG